jgi:predicted DsbA family dithiol-disulfide isomerase
MNKKVWMIGVDPACPRCDLLRQRIANLIKETNKTIDFKKLVYTDQEARDFAASIGKEPGTAHDVEERAGIQVDWNRLNELKLSPLSEPEDIDILVGPAAQWSSEFDEVLRPCQKKAESVGVLMTPVLIIDGKVKHHGSVPSIEQLRMWLT